MVKTTLEESRAAAEVRFTALTNAERHYVAETPWYWLLYALGIPSTILSAVAGATAFAKFPDWVTGTLAIGAAILSGLTTFLEPAKKASAHHAAAKEYEALYREADVGLVETNFEEKRTIDILNRLSSKLNSLSKTSPTIPGMARRVAERRMAKGTGEVVQLRPPTPAPNQPQPSPPVV